MPKYLIDANLPYYFSLWNNSNFIHVKDLDDSWSDEIIWLYAKENNLIIITKDADFSLKVLNKGYPPKVIHLKIGNLRIRELHDIMARNWINIESLIEDSCLLNVYIDKIETIK
jgi:predicted nuclease of predicted toxin-antitoxin system